MKQLSYLLGSWLTAALLAACGGGGSGLTSSTTQAVLPQSIGSHRVLTSVAGTLYGTTETGGSQNKGTVYSITPSGVEAVLHNFAGGGNDGAYPVAGLTNVSGVLYGTTYEGGSSQSAGQGTVFKIATNGAYTQLRNFVSGNDGAYPLAGLTDVGGVLYGTTYAGGGSQDLGTVFKIATNGAYTQLHNFVGGGNDGASPQAGLTNVGGVLYGTTVSGGGSPGLGTVFKIATNGAYSQLHKFVGGGNDGAFPEAGLINVGGVLYGTTTRGGGSQNLGSVFKIARHGAYTQLHNFVGGANDGALPEAGLTNVGGVLYGTTDEGGGSRNLGTVFKMATNGAYTQLHNFVGGANDGANPRAGLIDVGGVLYGTTSAGGGLSYGGGGTVFKIAPNGAYTQLHAFVRGGNDGVFPAAALWGTPPVLTAAPAATEPSLRHR